MQKKTDIGGKHGTKLQFLKIFYETLEKRLKTKGVECYNMCIGMRNFPNPPKNSMEECMKLKKWLIAGLSLAMAGCLSLAVAACAGPANGGGEGEGGGHSHTYTQWARDDDQHWKVCPDDGAEDPAGKTAHAFVEGACECGATEAVETAWTIGDDGVVTEWKGKGTVITLPKTVGGTAVKKIAATAFAENENAANVTKLYVGCFTNGFSYLESGALDVLTGCTEVVYYENWEKAGNSPIYNQKTFLSRIKKVTFTEEVLLTPQAACSDMGALESVEFKGEVKEFRASLFANRLARNSLTSPLNSTLSRAPMSEQAACGVSNTSSVKVTFLMRERKVFWL